MKPKYENGTRLTDELGQVATVMKSEKLGDFTIYRMRYDAKGVEFQATEGALDKFTVVERPGGTNGSRAAGT